MRTKPASPSTLFPNLREIEARYDRHFQINWTKRASVAAVITIAVAIFVFGFAAIGFSWQKIWTGLGEFGSFIKLMLPPSYDRPDKLWLYLGGLSETLAIAFLGTMLAALIAFPLGFLAAKNVIANRIIHFLSRRSLDTVRSIDALIWALIWINVVGPGPFAGILAIMTVDIGAFGKLFSEAIENADGKPVDGVKASGGTRLDVMRFALIPQVLPVMASQVLYLIEANARAATIIGIVGAGGIGLYLSEAIRTLEWQNVSFLILMILVMVAILDAISARLRTALIGQSSV